MVHHTVRIVARAMLRRCRVASVWRVHASARYMPRVLKRRVGTESFRVPSWVFWDSAASLENSSVVIAYSKMV